MSEFDDNEEPPIDEEFSLEERRMIDIWLSPPPGVFDGMSERIINEFKEKQRLIQEWLAKLPDTIRINTRRALSRGHVKDDGSDKVKKINLSRLGLNVLDLPKPPDDNARNALAIVLGVEPSTIELKDNPGQQYPEE